MKKNGKITTKNKGKPGQVINNLTDPLKYKNTQIQELKDEYNESKLSFNDPKEEFKNKNFELDIEAMIEDKLCALFHHIASDYYEVTREVYKKISEQ